MSFRIRSAGSVCLTGSVSGGTIATAWEKLHAAAEHDQFDHDCSRLLHIQFVASDVGPELLN